MEAPWLNFLLFCGCLGGPNVAAYPRTLEPGVATESLWRRQLLHQNPALASCVLPAVLLSQLAVFKSHKEDALQIFKKNS